MSLQTVFRKGYKTKCVEPTNFAVEIIPGKSIAIFERADAGSEFELRNTFAMGDLAEYDSYNLSYYGPIESISKTTVVVGTRYSSKRNFMDLYKFCWRNKNFEIDKVQASNAETSMCI